MEKETGKCANCSAMCTEKIDFLAGLPYEKHGMITEGAVREKHKKGSYLFREGDPVDALYIIHSGKVKLSTESSDGREQIVGIFSEND